MTFRRRSATGWRLASTRRSTGTHPSLRIRTDLIPEGQRKWWTLGAMCCALFAFMLDATVVNVALPAMQRELHGGLTGLEWVLNAYTVALAVLMVSGGRMGDIFGRRRMFLLGIAGFAISSAAIGAASDQTWVIVGRAAQGASAALMCPATLSILSHTFPPEERGRAFGIWAGVSALGLASGPLIGGLLTDAVSWRAIFYLNVPVAIAAVTVALLAAEESRDESTRRSLDIGGTVTLTLSLSALVFAIVDGNSWGWGSPRIIALLAIATAAAVAFVITELRVSAPVVPLDFFAARGFIGAAMVGLSVSFVMFGLFFFLSLYLQNVQGYTPLQAGVRTLPATLMIMVAGPLVGRVTDRIGPRIPLTAGMTITAGSVLWMSFIEPGTGYWFIAIGLTTFGIGVGLVMTPMTTAAMNALPEGKAGVASGVLNMTRMVGAALGVAVVGAIVQSLGQRRLYELLPPTIPASAHARLNDALSLGGAGVSGAPAAIVVALHNAFVYALDRGLVLCAALAAGTAVVAAAVVRGVSRETRRTRLAARDDRVVDPA